ncbi:MAG TPA: hypothetical protein VIQ29_25660 [Ancylobacter sp.]
MIGSILLGALVFCNVSGLALYVAQLAMPTGPETLTFLDINMSAANAGIALRAIIGGLVAESRLGLGATPWVGAIMVGAGLLLTLWSGSLDKSEARASSCIMSDNCIVPRLVPQRPEQLRSRQIGYREIR